MLPVQSTAVFNSAPFSRFPNNSFVTDFNHAEPDFRGVSIQTRIRLCITQKGNVVRLDLRHAAGVGGVDRLPRGRVIDGVCTPAEVQ